MSEYRATIERKARWGPMAWYVRYTSGLVALEPGSFAWTERGAERKARRMMASWRASEERRVASRRSISG